MNNKNRQGSWMVSSLKIFALSCEVADFLDGVNYNKLQDNEILESISDYFHCLVTNDIASIEDALLEERKCIDLSDIEQHVKLNLLIKQVKEHKKS